MWGTLAHHVTLVGSDTSYIKEAPRIDGVVCKSTVIAFKRNPSDFD